MLNKKRKESRRIYSPREKPGDIYDLITSIRTTYGLKEVTDDFRELRELHNLLDPSLYVIAAKDLGEFKKPVAIPVGTLGRILFLYEEDPRKIELEFYPDLRGEKAIQKLLQDQDDSYQGRRICHLTDFDEIKEEFIILGEYNRFFLED